jgi:hypothetical protein
MSRCIGCLFLLLISLFPVANVFADATGYELGFRTGVGSRVPGRFDSDLNQFSSTFSPLVYSNLNISGGKQIQTYDLFIRWMLDSRSRVGFTIGRNDWENLKLTEVTSDFYYTRLNSEIYSYHFLGMYHFNFPLSRHFEWETGLGMGFASADWRIRGYSIGELPPNTQFFRQVGILRGSGLTFRGETAINRRLVDSTFFQFGIAYQHIAIDKFSGNYNGEVSSFYIRNDGRVGVFDDTRILDANVSSAQSFRRLDMNTGAWTLYFSVFQRFLD